MQKKKSDKVNDLYYLEKQMESEKKETLEEMMKRKKKKERERNQRIEKLKQEENRNLQFETDIKTAVNMDYQNRKRQNNIPKSQNKQRKKNNKQKKKNNKVNNKNFNNNKNIKNQNNKSSMKKNISPQVERKRKKRLKRIKTFLKIFLFIGIIGGGTAFAFTSPIFNIKDIKVVNNNKIATNTIISLSSLQMNENIFKFNSRDIINNIKEEPYIENVAIHRKLPDNIEIDVTERIAKYAIEYMGKYAYIDKAGNILEIADNNQNMLIISGISTNESDITPGKKLNDADFKKLDDIGKIMNSFEESNLNDKITSIDIKSKNDYIIYLADEKKNIHIGDTSNLNNKILYIQAILEQEKGNEGDIYVNGDLNNGFNPYFRSKV